MFLSKRSLAHLWEKMKSYVSDNAFLRTDPPIFYFDVDTGALYIKEEFLSETSANSDDQ